jgi:hypothetical protein
MATPAPARQRALAVTAVLAAFGIAVGVRWMVLDYAATYAPLGLMLPQPTRLAIDYLDAVFAWPVIVAVLAILWRGRVDRGWPLLTIALGGGALLFGLALWAMYLPTMPLG